MTLPPPNATTDEWDEWYADQECLLRERLDLALTMLRRFTRGWRIIDLGEPGLWWNHAIGESPFDKPDMALTPDESRLWEALRKGAK